MTDGPIRLKDFPQKDEPVAADIFYMANSEASDREVKVPLENVTSKIKTSLIANPSNNLYWGPSSFTQNGTMINGQPTITGLGSTSRMYAGMSVIVPTVAGDTTIISVDSDSAITVSGNSNYSGLVTSTFNTDREGSDTTGTGQIIEPFGSYEKAMSRAKELGAGQGNEFNLIYLGSYYSMGTFTISPSVYIDGNGAVFTWSVCVLDPAWDIDSGKVILSNMRITNTFDFDSHSSSTQKSVIFNNVNPTNTDVDLLFTGTGNQIFYWINSEQASPKSIQLVNFSAAIDVDTSAAGVDGITSVNSLAATAILLNITKSAQSAINVRSSAATAGNYFVTRGAELSGAITLDGADVNWSYDSTSYVEPTILNGATTTPITPFESLVVPASDTALTTDKLIGLKTATSENATFLISQLLGLGTTDWRMAQINHASATPLLMTRNAVYNSRLASGGSPCAFTLPAKASWSAGDWVMVVGLGSKGWTVGIGDNDAIIFNGSNLPTSVRSAHQFDCALFYCTDPGQINVAWFNMAMDFVGVTKPTATMVAPFAPETLFTSSTPESNPYVTFDTTTGIWTCKFPGTYKFHYKTSVSFLGPGYYYNYMFPFINGDIYGPGEALAFCDNDLSSSSFTLNGFFAKNFVAGDTVYIQMGNEGSLDAYCTNSFITIKQVRQP